MRRYLLQIFFLSFIGVLTGCKSSGDSASENSEADQSILACDQSGHNDVIALLSKSSKQLCISDTKTNWTLSIEPVNGMVEKITENIYQYTPQSGFSGTDAVVFTDRSGKQTKKHFFVTGLENAFKLSGVSSDRATAYPDSNKIVTIGTKTHVTWLDEEDGTFFIRVRTLDQSSNTWGETYTVDTAEDNHGGAAMVADSEGFLHIVYYPHSGTFRYRQSLKPNDVSAWGETEFFGTNGTYPALGVLADDTLVLIARHSRWQEPWYLSFYRRAKNGEWSDAKPVVEGNIGSWLSNAHPDYYSTIYFQSMLVGSDGQSIHLGFTIAEAPFGELPGKGYFIGYIHSTDGGLTWKGKDNETFNTPILPENVEIVTGDTIPIDDVDYFVGNMAMDPLGRPWILYCRLDYRPYEAWLAMRQANGSWITKELLPHVNDVFPEVEIHMPGSITFDDRGNLFMVLTSTHNSAGGDYPYHGHKTSNVLALVSGDYGKSFDVTELAHFNTEADDQKMNWLPNLEVSTTSALVESPGVLFTRSVVDEELAYQMVSNEAYYTQFNAEHDRSEFVTVNRVNTSERKPALSGMVSSSIKSVEATINKISYVANIENNTWYIEQGILEELANGTYDVSLTAVDQSGENLTDLTYGEVLIDASQ
ncbi:MAG: BNR repeat-containing protein [Pseudomonadales bacterium]|nr:BNR repeat-containing protein [Pseudomonadales bacterium]